MAQDRVYKIRIGNLRKIIREALKTSLNEVVQLTPQMIAAKDAISKVDSTLGQKANILFSRLSSDRIEDVEAQEISKEIKSMISQIPKKEISSKLDTMFSYALRSFDAKKAENQKGTSKIQNMISSTLNSPSAKGSSLKQTTKLSAAKKANPEYFDIKSTMN